MKKFILSCFILSLFYSSIYSQNTYQPGYIIKEQGDTVKGYILTAGIEALEQNCSFKTSTDSDVILYSPSQLKGYEITGIGRFETLDLIPENSEAQGKVFASVLVKGYTSLFSYKDNLYYQTATLKTYKLEIVKKIITKNGQAFEQIQPAYKGILGSLMNDCDKVKGRVNKVALKAKPLSELVNTYNSCFSESKSEIVKNKTLGFDVYASLLFTANNYSYTYQNTSAFYINFDQFLEKRSLILPTLSFKVISKRSNFGFEINLIHSTNNEFKSDFVGNNGFRYTTSFNFSTIQIPLSLSYNFKLQSFTPFVEAGANQILVTPDNKNNETDLIALNQSTNQVTLLQGDYLIGRKSYLKPLTGIGTFYKLSNKIDLMIRLRFEFGGSALLGYTDPSTNGIVGFTHEPIRLSSGVTIPKEYLKERIMSVAFGLTYKL